jgi:hypothetical protein
MDLMYCFLLTSVGLPRKSKISKYRYEAKPLLERKGGRRLKEKKKWAFWLNLEGVYLCCFLQRVADLLRVVLSNHTLFTYYGSVESIQIGNRGGRKGRASS